MQTALWTFFRSTLLIREDDHCELEDPFAKKHGVLLNSGFKTTFLTVVAWQNSRQAQSPGD